jgi:hypothetical protein
MFLLPIGFYYALVVVPCYFGSFHIILYVPSSNRHNAYINDYMTVILFIFFIIICEPSTHVRAVVVMSNNHVHFYS